MSVFTRKIHLDHLRILGDRTLPWLDDLFCRWTPAGSSAREGQSALRFAIRNGYANFYANGQSISQLKMGPRSFYASVHSKYFQPNKVERDKLEQKYISIKTAADYDSHKTEDSEYETEISKWIKIAAEYSSKEKRFVEQIVANNENVIDLEMGLPALEGVERKTAVRIDLVALEKADGGWRLVFWEAKMAKNPEARAKSNMPKVMGQVQRYKNWLAGSSKNEEIVLNAYRGVCEYLVDIHNLVSKSNCGKGLGALGKGIKAVADGAPLVLDNQIRLIIDNSIENESFEGNGHREKLEKNGIPVQVVEKGGDHKLQREFPNLVSQ